MNISNLEHEELLNTPYKKFLRGFSGGKEKDVYIFESHGKFTALEYDKKDGYEIYDNLTEKMLNKILNASGNKSFIIHNLELELNLEDKLNNNVFFLDTTTYFDFRTMELVETQELSIYPQEDVSSGTIFYDAKQFLEAIFDPEKYKEITSIEPLDSVIKKSTKSMFSPFSSNEESEDEMGIGRARIPVATLIDGR